MFSHCRLHISPLKVEKSQKNVLMIKILCLTIIHFNIWKMIGQGRSLFAHSLHLKRESSWVHVSNSEKNMKTKTKGAHLWALCGGWAKTPFPPQRIGSIRHLASCRHLRWMNVSSLPSPPLRIIWQCPFDQRSAAASPMEVKCIKLYRYVIVLWISILDCITIVSVVLPRGFPYWVWMMFKIYGYM